jgi:type I restriction enzyme M protein
VIVPDGILFGSSNAHKQLRQTIVEGHKLDAVISMPSGVFKPYAGVSTAILIFTKTNNGGTDKVWFYDMQADGFSLDDKRTELKDKEGNNDIPDIIVRYTQLDGEQNRTRIDKSFLVPLDDIKKNDWSLSIKTYKEVVHEEIEYDSPSKVIANIEQLDDERKQALCTLKELLEC